MSDLEKIVADMRHVVGNLPMLSNTRVGVPRATITNWADRLDSLRQVPDGYVLVPEVATLDMAKSLMSGAHSYDYRNGSESRKDELVEHYQSVYRGLLVTAKQANPAQPTSGAERIERIGELLFEDWNRYDNREGGAMAFYRDAIRKMVANPAREVGKQATPAQAWSELPEPAFKLHGVAGTENLYTADQMRAYAELARRGGS